jgi:hypothetical protein
MMLTMQEIELLAGLLSRAGVTQIEAIWANSIMDRLRTAALEQQATAPPVQPTEEERDG